MVVLFSCRQCGSTAPSHPWEKTTIDGSICSNKPFSNGIRGKSLEYSWIRNMTLRWLVGSPGFNTIEARTPLMAHTTASSHERLSFAKQVAIGCFHWHHLHAYHAYLVIGGLDLATLLKSSMQELHDYVLPKRRAGWLLFHIISKLPPASFSWLSIQHLKCL